MPGPRSRIDFATVAAVALAAADHLLPQWLPNGKRVGREWQCGSLFGEAGSSFSCNLKTGAWADLASDDRGGDLVSLYAALHGLKQGAAARALALELGLAGGETEVPKRETKAAQTEKDGGWHDAGGWSAGGPPPPAAHSFRGVPQARWTYTDAAGGVRGYVCRFVKSNGDKEILPLVWSRHPTKGMAWRWRAFDAPRPLYALDRLAAHPQAPVLVVEDEKCAELAQRVIGDGCVVTTWPGGAKAVARADWSPLARRRVVIWPDCDAERDRGGEVKREDRQPGMLAAEAIAVALVALAADVRIVRIPLPNEKQPGWDVADCIAEAGGAEDPRARASVLAWLAPERLRAPDGLTTPPGAARAEISEVPTVEPEKWQRQLRIERGALVKHAANIVLVLRNDARWRGVIGFDEFAYAVVKRAPPPYAFGRAGEWTADDDTRTSVWLAQHYHLDVAGKQVVEAIEMLAREQTFHPVVEYLRALKWDGMRRAQSWLVDYVGVTDCEYARAAGAYFLRGMVRRVMEPGCKFDYCLVLEGAEGLRKSTLASVLGAGWGSDTPLDLSNNREAALAVHGNWVIEFSEMESVTRAEAHLQKSFLSRTFDQYRPFWSGRNVKVPRQSVFIGTTNETEYIKEGLGARRFWPFAVLRKIDIDGLKRVLPQLLAEAVADYDAGERCYPDDDEQDALFAPEQARRVVQESLIDALHDWVLTPELDEQQERLNHDGAFSLADAAWRCLKVSYAQLTRDLQTRIGKALAALGCERLEKRNGMTRYWYKPPAKKAARSETSGMPAQQLEGGDAPPF